jgi:hypothetical protein
VCVGAHDTLTAAGSGVNAFADSVLGGAAPAALGGFAMSSLCPLGVASGAGSGAPVVADASHRLRLVAANGSLSTLAGSGVVAGGGILAVDGAAAGATFYAPAGRA